MVKFEDTGDGSPTLYSSIYQAAYHSRRGALAEGLHVFIRNGVQWYRRENQYISEINLLEMGIGSGLNAFLAAQYAMKNNFKISYTGIEKHPIPYTLNEEYITSDYFRDQAYYSFFQEFIEAEWEEDHFLNDFFSFRKYQMDFLDYTVENEYDVLFYDAFGPRAQPELWDLTACEIMYRVLRPKGILTTFCAQGQFKRNLKTLGFKVYSLEGAIGKREMVLAVK